MYMFMCDGRINFFSVSLLFQLNFGTIQRVWYFFIFRLISPHCIFCKHQGSPTMFWLFFFSFLWFFGFVLFVFILFLVHNVSCLIGFQLIAPLVFSNVYITNIMKTVNTDTIHFPDSSYISLLKNNYD